MDRYTTLAARQMFEKGKRATRLELLFHPPIAFARNYILKGGFRDGKARAHHLARELVLRDAEVREALGAAARLDVGLWTRLCFPFTSTQRGPGEADSARCCSPCSACASAATARCSSRIPKASSPERASEGHDLIRLAPRAEVDLHAGWKLSRIIKDLRPDIVHAHDPHAVALASLALSFMTSGKCPGADRLAPRRVPSEGERVLALEVSPGRLLRRRVERHPRDAHRRRHRRRSGRDRLRGHRSAPRAGRAAGQHPRGVLAADARADRRRGRGADAGEGAQVPDRRRSAGRARRARRAVRHSRRRRAAAGARTADQGAASREARRCFRDSAPTFCRSSGASTCSS